MLTNRATSPEATSRFKIGCWQKVLPLSVLIFLSIQLRGIARDIFPIEFPNVRLDARADQYVLCPPKRLINHALSRTGSRQSYVFLPAILKRMEADFAYVDTPDNRVETIPNYLIIPIQPGQVVHPKQIVLTWWQKKSQMNRAIVVGGTPERPKVRYLDIQFDHPSGAGKTDRALDANTFHLLSKPWQPGTMIAFPAIDKDRAPKARVQEGSREHSYGQVIAVSDDKILALEFGGRISEQSKSNAVPVPIHPTVKNKDQIFVAYRGRIREAVAGTTDERNGQVACKIRIGEETKLVTMPVGNILKQLPDYDLKDVHKARP